MWQELVVALVVVVAAVYVGAKYAWMMAGYMFALAYTASFITYRVALALGGG